MLKKLNSQSQFCFLDYSVVSTVVCDNNKLRNYLLISWALSPLYEMQAENAVNLLKTERTEEFR